MNNYQDSGGFFKSLLLVTFIWGASVQAQTQQCPDNWTRLKGKCFLFVNETLDYSGAYQNCIDEGGRLFEPKNQPANGLVAKVAGYELAGDYWIGITDQLNEGKYIYNSSGLEAKFSSWADGQPDYSGDCVYVNGKDWNNVDCSSTFKSICEDMEDDLEDWIACIPGWDLIGKKCYRHVPKTVKFSTAKDLCHSLGAKVFEPKNEMQEEMVHEFYQSPKTWIGITDLKTEGTFSYASTGASIGYTNWNSTSEPIEEDCVVMSDNGWDDFDCNCADEAQVICEELSVTCPHEDGWELINGRCFYFSQDKVSYEDAESSCLDKGSRLFEPRNAEANVLIYEYVYIISKIQYWIGIIDDGQENFVYTSSQGDIAYEQWDTNEPNHENVRANCTLVNDHQANWADYNCKAKRNYVCEQVLTYNPFWDSIPLDASNTGSIEYIFNAFFKTEQCNEEEDTEVVDPTTEPPTTDPPVTEPPEESKLRYLTFGGYDETEDETNEVYLYDFETNTSCLHSIMPLEFKEGHVYEYMDTLLVCTSSSKNDSMNLQCLKWNPLEGWETFATPTDNAVKLFISSVKIPGVGIWFFSQNAVILATDNGTWSSGFQWTTTRSRACAVMINSTMAAHIGGTPSSAGSTIDTYDFETNTENQQVVAAMPFNRKMHACATIPVGPNGNPTVAILGDNSPPYPFQMDLWDTVTNEFANVPHPPGWEDWRFFRPNLVPLDDTSVLLMGGLGYKDDNGTEITSLVDHAFIWSVDSGWADLGPAPSPLGQRQQQGIYHLNNPDLAAYTSLNRCAF